jgi:hypothetical protein
MLSFLHSIAQEISIVHLRDRTLRILLQITKLSRCSCSPTLTAYARVISLHISASWGHIPSIHMNLLSPNTRTEGHIRFEDVTSER